MQTYLIEKSKNSVKLGFKEINLTLITPILKALDDDDDVIIVRYIDKHPELQDRVLYVETKKGDAMKAVQKAAESVSGYYTIN
ncbi:MAG: hypothetical protein E7Z64_06315 [Thermoplasmata archaeon]|nr:hypothetical protein [Thermoplasmata archaeon]